jgi:Ca-activated chloride channel homolog
MTDPMTVPYWREPLWLLAAVYPLLLWAWGRWRRQAVRRGYADPGLWPWVQTAEPPARDRGLARPLLALAWLLLTIAAAGPRLPLDLSETARPPAGALLVVLDLSRSMEVRDLGGASGGSRRAAALRLVDDWNREPDRPPLGLILFAGRAHLLFPPSPDPGAVAHVLDQLPGIVLPTLGNDLAGALTLAGQVIDGIDGPRAIALLSDGDLDGPARERAEAAAAGLRRAQDLDLRVIGVGGTTATAVPDPGKGWLTLEGRPVVSRLESKWLGRLAEAGGGDYRPLSTDGRINLGDLWSRPAPRIAAADRDQVLWRELYSWALVPGALLLGLALLGRRASGTAALALAAGITLPAPVPAVDGDSAFAALARGADQEARLAYARLPGYAGRLGEGVACFRLQDWACAAESFAAAAWLAEDDLPRARAAYNLAATLYQQGDYGAAATLYRDAQAHGLAHPRLESLIAITDNLSAQVAERQAQQAGALQRSQTGSRVPDDADTLVVERDLDLAPPPPPPLPMGLDRRTYDDLIARGLDQARLAETTSGEAQAGRTWFRSDGAEAERTGTQLWQRLLEMEEGFLAPLAAPRPRPDERPW